MGLPLPVQAPTKSVPVILGPCSTRESWCLAGWWELFELIGGKFSLPTTSRSCVCLASSSMDTSRWPSTLRAESTVPRLKLRNEALLSEWPGNDSAELSNSSNDWRSASARMLSLLCRSRVNGTSSWWGDTRSTRRSRVFLRRGGLVKEAAEYSCVNGFMVLKWKRVSRIGVQVFQKWSMTLRPTGPAFGFSCLSPLFQSES